MDKHGIETQEESALTFARGFKGPSSRGYGVGEDQKEGNAHPYGEENLPQNRIVLAALCLIKKRKGWSAQNVGPGAEQHSKTTMPDAAAASVPSSFTSTKLLCTNLDRHRPLSPDSAERSALSS